MSGVARFGVSLERGLLGKFDRYLKENKYPNRSEAIRDLIRDALVEGEWKAEKGTVSGVITIVYDHHKRELTNRLTHFQHDHYGLIISTQHIHLDHHNCMEVIVVRGGARAIVGLEKALRAMKGVKHGRLIMTTLGKGLA
jgi:CopG family nickel-responsive transcriptional regulator